MKKIMLVSFSILLILTGLIYLTVKFIYPNLTQGSAKQPEPLPNNAFYTDLEGFNYTYYQNLSIQSTILFQIISAAPLENDDIKIETDQKIPIKYGIEKVLPENKLPYYIYQNYNGTDWKALMNLYIASLSESGMKPGSKEKIAFNASVDKLKASYDKIDMTKFNGINIYRGYINIDRLLGSALYPDIKQIKITACGIEHVFNGEISFLPDPEIHTGGGMTIRTPGITDKPILPCPEGIIFLDLNSEAAIAKDIKITGFRILQDNITMVSTNIVITDNKKTMDIEFAGKPVNIKAGSGIVMNFIIRDKNLVNRLNYMANAIVLIDYETAEGRYSESIDVTYRRRQDPFETIAIQKDKINFLSYYYDFFDGIYHNH